MSDDEGLAVDPLEDAFFWLTKHLDGNDREAHERILRFAETVIRTQLRRGIPETLGQIRSMVEGLKMHLLAAIAGNDGSPGVCLGWDGCRESGSPRAEGSAVTAMAGGAWGPRGHVAGVISV